jgi:hypothetical protein
MVSSNGERFLMNTLMEEPASPIVVLLNWKPAATDRDAAHPER